MLVKHANMSLSDVYKLTYVERDIYIKLLKEEWEREKQEIENLRNR
jgi:hypothetical protein